MCQSGQTLQHELSSRNCEVLWSCLPEGCAGKCHGNCVCYLQCLNSLHWIQVTGDCNLTLSFKMLHESSSLSLALPSAHMAAGTLCSSITWASGSWVSEAPFWNAVWGVKVSRHREFRGNQGKELCVSPHSSKAWPKGRGRFWKSSLARRGSFSTDYRLAGQTLAPLRWHWIGKQFHI